LPAFPARRSSDLLLLNAGTAKPQFAPAAPLGRTFIRRQLRRCRQDREWEGNLSTPLTISPPPYDIFGFKWQRPSDDGSPPQLINDLICHGFRAVRGALQDQFCVLWRLIG